MQVTPHLLKAGKYTIEQIGGIPQRMKCVVDGCGSAANARSMCKLHYCRWRRHGDPTAGRTREGEIWEFVERAVLHQEIECLIWPYGKIKGYAAVGGKYISRIVCERVRGAAPFDGAESLHDCGNGNIGCVSGRHLRWGTHAENMADMSRHGRSNRGRTLHSMEARARISAQAKAQIKVAGRFARVP